MTDIAARLLSEGPTKVRTLRGSRPPFAWSRNGDLAVTGNLRGGLSVYSSSGRKLSDVEVPKPIHDIAVGKNLIAALTARTLVFWDLESLVLVAEFPIARGQRIAWSENGEHLAVLPDSGGDVVVYNAQRLDEPTIYTLPNGVDVTLDIKWLGDNRRIAVASYSIHIIDVETGHISSVGSAIGNYEIAYTRTRNDYLLAAGNAESTIEIIYADSLDVAIVLEGHHSHVRSLSFSSDGRFLLSSSDEGVRCWRTEDWKTVARINIKEATVRFNPESPLAAIFEGGRPVSLWYFDADIADRILDDGQQIIYKSAKIVLVGDSGVGKTGLGWRLAHGAFKEHSSTHGQQFWVLDKASQISDSTQKEAILWDLAGQPDYRLVHALFLDDADLALLVFDPTEHDNPLRGVDYWVNQLRLSTQNSGSAGPPAALVAARCDRGTARIGQEELHQFCNTYGLSDYFETSASTGLGLDRLMKRIPELIEWDRKPATVTTKTFQIIRDYVLEMKASGNFTSPIVTLDELQSLLTAENHQEYNHDELKIAVGHLAHHGYIALVSDGTGDAKILLQPGLLNNLASSLVLEARRHPKGLGALTERQIISADFAQSELGHLKKADKDVLLAASVSLFLRHNICFRQNDPLNSESYLVFPELINMRKPANAGGENTEDETSYVVSGATENVYSSLVVLLGFTSTFVRTSQWQGQARYEVHGGLICGFRLEEDQTDHLNIVLYFGVDVGEAVRNLFRALVENFLSRHDVSIEKFAPVACVNGHMINRATVREHRKLGEAAAFCSRCGDRVALQLSSGTILRLDDNLVVAAESRAADQRARLERALYLLSQARGDSRPAPSCFISYAWGDESQEEWVEKRLASDLAKAGVEVHLDRWHNAQIGASVARFAELAASADIVVVVGTPNYKNKYRNDTKGSIAAAEADMINVRLTGTETEKSAVMPILLSGSEKEAFPNLIRGRVYADFRETSAYVDQLVQLALSVYGIGPREPISINIREILRGQFR